MADRHGESKRGGRSREDWERLVSEYGASALSRKAFCAERSIAVTSLDYWRKKMTPKEATAGFVELGAVDAGASAWDVELSLGGGMVLRLRRG